MTLQFIAWCLLAISWAVFAGFAILVFRHLEATWRKSAEEHLPALWQFELVGGELDGRRLAADAPAADGSVFVSGGRVLEITRARDDQQRPIVAGDGTPCYWWQEVQA